MISFFQLYLPLFLPEGSWNNHKEFLSTFLHHPDTNISTRQVLSPLDVVYDPCATSLSPPRWFSFFPPFAPYVFLVLLYILLYLQWILPSILHYLNQEMSSFWAEVNIVASR